jgi:two-component system response regulator RegX3
MFVDALQHQLRREGYEVLTAFDGVQALDAARQYQPDLILLDVMMPKLQGWDVCRILRSESAIPILMLTALGDELDRVLGLELGADDYITKPFSFRELLARIRANLRRVTLERADDSRVTTDAATNGDAPIQLGWLTIDRSRYILLREGQPVHLSRREFDLLLALLETAGAVVKRADLLDRVWGNEWFGDPRTLDVHIRGLREKLERDPAQPQLILTVRGVGYRLVAPDEVAPDKVTPDGLRHEPSTHD